MSRFKKIILSLGVVATMAIAFVVGLVAVKPNDKPNAPTAPASTNKVVQKPVSYTYKPGEVMLQNGGDQISYNYVPSVNSGDPVSANPKAVAYEYIFGNVKNGETTGINIKEIDTTDVKVSYAWSTTGKLNVEDESLVTYTNFELQKIEAGGIVYIYIIVAPNEGVENIPVTFTSSVIWYYGIPKEIPIINNITSEITYQPLISGQSIDKNTLTAPESFVKDEDGTEVTYYFDAWFLDEKYTQLLYEDEVKPSQKVYARYANFPKDTTEYTSFENGVYTITSTPGLTNLIVPNIYNNGTNGDAQIVAIGDSAFRSCTSLTNITLPSSLTSIGNNAFFNCDKLTSVDLSAGSSLTSIGERIFRGCASLTSIDLSGCTSLTSIGNYAFTDSTGLTSIDLSAGSSLTSIGNHAFTGCTSLTNITLPSSLTSIGSSAFTGCTSLTNITLPSSLTSIGSYVFYGCYALAEVYNLSSLNITAGSASNGFVAEYAGIVVNGPRDESKLITIDGVYYYKNSETSYTALRLSDKTKTSIILDSRTILIGGYAFYNCSTLTSVTLPNSVTSIENSAFENCTGLTSIDLSNCTSLTRIVEYAFEECTGLTSIDLSNCTSLTRIGGNAFQYCSKLASIVIPANVSAIGASAFSGCANLVEIYNLSSRNIVAGTGYASTSLGEYAKVVHTSLSTPSRIQDIDNVKYYIGVKDIIALYAIDKNITSHTLINGTIEIKQEAFYQCSNLTSINLPSSLTSIGSSAFSGCGSLTSLTFASGGTWYYTDSSDYTGGTSFEIVAGTDYKSTFTSGSTCSQYWYKAS